MANKIKVPEEVKEAIELFRKHNPVFKHSDDTTILMYALDFTTAHIMKERTNQKLLH